MAALRRSIFALNNDCFTLVLKFLKLQDLMNIDVCASGEKKQVHRDSSYLNSLQYLGVDNLMDRKETHNCNSGSSSQSVAWAGRKNLRCLLSATRISLGTYNHRLEGEEKSEDAKSKQVRLCAYMDEALCVIGSKCTALVEIYLIGNAITDRGMVALLAGKRTPITEIFLSQCQGITDVAMAAIGEHLRDSLTDVYICNCPVSDAGLIQVIKGCPKITSLSLDFREFIHDDAEKVRRFPAPAYHITAATLFAIAQSLPDLDSLHCQCWGFYRSN